MRFTDVHQAISMVWKSPTGLKPDARRPKERVCLSRYRDENLGLGWDRGCGQRRR